MFTGKLDMAPPVSVSEAGIEQVALCGAVEQESWTVPAKPVAACIWSWYFAVSPA